MNRRNYLTGIATTGSIAFAGCLGSDDDNSGGTVSNQEINIDDLIFVDHEFGVPDRFGEPRMGATLRNDRDEVVETTMIDVSMYQDDFEIVSGYIIFNDLLPGEERTIPLDDINSMSLRDVNDPDLVTDYEIQIRESVSGDPIRTIEYDEDDFRSRHR